jgi:hypothetical protein
MEFVDFLKNPNKYKDLGAKIPKGALLVRGREGRVRARQRGCHSHGPPGPHGPPALCGRGPVREGRVWHT